MGELVIGPEYGERYTGVWVIRQLSYSEIRPLLSKVARTRDQIDYIEEITLLAVSGPVKLSKDSIGSHPSGLLRRLQTAALAANETTGEETAFLSNWPSEAAPSSQPTATPSSKTSSSTTP